MKLIIFILRQTSLMFFEIFKVIKQMQILFSVDCNSKLLIANALIIESISKTHVLYLSEVKL